MANWTGSLTFIIVSFILYACGSGVTETTDLQSGDILFRASSGEGLSQAIDQVTQTAKGTNYSHMGVVENDEGQIWVLHAIPNKGVCREPLDSFSQPGTQVDVYRITNLSKETVDRAIAKAKIAIGQPYNFTYLFPDSGFYCSELVYHMFEQAQIFMLNPMTFKDASTDTFPDTWVEHYQDLGIPIPEGEPGCNPNGMANSDRLQFLKTLAPYNKRETPEHEVRASHN